MKAPEKHLDVNKEISHFHNIFSQYSLSATSEVWSGPTETSKMDSFAKTI